MTQTLEYQIDRSTTIAELEAMHPQEGTIVYLDLGGRSGNFRGTTASIATEVTADTQQGIYIAAFGDATGASGGWVRQYAQAVDSDPQVRLGWFGGVADGSTDSTNAFIGAFAFSNTPILDDGEYLVDEIDMPTKTNLIGNGRHNTRIIVTGAGGGAISEETNGGVRAFKGFNEIRDITLSFNNPALQGLLNIGESGGSAVGRIHLENVDLAVESSLAATDIDCIAVFLSNLVEFTWVNGQIGTFPNFKQALVMRGFFNGCSIKGVTFRPNAEDIPNGVFHSINPILDINGSTQAALFDNCTFEQGPNGIKCVGQGPISFDTCYLGDGSKAEGFWLPSTAYAQGDFVYPSLSVTGSATAASADLTGVSSTAALYVGQQIVVIGAGVAGAGLQTRIDSISGTTVTMEDTASTTAATTGVYFGAYDQHGYMVTVAGTTGSSVPTFPTTLGDTVADGTATLKEYGACAWLDANTAGGLTGKNSITLNNCFVGSSIIGVSARRTGPTPGAVNITGGLFLDMNLFGQFNGNGATVIKGVSIRDYEQCGFEFLGSGGSCWNNEVGPMYQINNLPADVVVSTNNNNMGGLSIGAHTVTGIGKSKFTIINTKNPSPEIVMSGYLSIDDGTTAPGADANNARIYVDSADGDLKVVFSDGTVKTIVVDT